MPELLQIWIVIVTIALLVIAVLTARMMDRHLSRVADDLSRLTAAVSESVEQINLVTQEARELVASARGFVTPVQRVVDRFVDIGQRTATLSSTLLEAVEPPVFIAAAVTQGVRTGANLLLNQLLLRFTHRRTSINGDHDHE